MSKVRQFVKELEGIGKFTSQRSGQAETQVTVTSGEPIPAPHGADVKSADEGDGSVTDNELAVIADVKAVQRQRVEPAQGAAGLLKWSPVSFGKGDRPKGIEEHPDFDAPLRGAHHGIAKRISWGAGLEDVHLELDELCGFVDGPAGGVKVFLAMA